MPQGNTSGTRNPFSARPRKLSPNFLSYRNGNSRTGPTRTARAAAIPAPAVGAQGKIDAATAAVKSTASKVWGSTKAFPTNYPGTTGFGVGAFKVAKAPFEGLGWASEKVGEVGVKVMRGPVNSFANTFERHGMIKGYLRGARWGAALGGVTALAEMGLHAPTSDDALARSQAGSAYSGNSGFGSRRASDIALRDSTENLVAGLHRSR